ncbi:MAG: vWA domain-containing protein [Planctomycetota bacterium]
MRLTSTWIFTRRSLLSSAALSVLLHAGTVVVVVLSMRGCALRSPGQSGGEIFRDVGLFVVEGSDDGQGDTGTAAGSGDAEVTRQTQRQASEPSPKNSIDIPKEQRSDIPAEIPGVAGLLASQSDSPSDGRTESSLPELIGSGALRSGRSGGTPGGAARADASESGGARRIGGKGGAGETTFMNIVGVGRSFVYVIDTSSSMDGPRLRQAKSQLKASLRLLQPNQQFAVILYNETTQRLKLRRQAEQSLYFATEVNRQLATQEIDSILSDAGTDHRPALLEALSLRPDVVYFLTDGDEPVLSVADLRDIRHAAQGTTIHVVRFGDGNWTRGSDHWLQQLAGQNQGEYRELAIPVN